MRCELHGSGGDGHEDRFPPILTWAASALRVELMVLRVAVEVMPLVPTRQISRTEHPAHSSGRTSSGRPHPPRNPPNSCREGAVEGVECGLWTGLTVVRVGVGAVADLRSGAVIGRWRGVVKPAPLRSGAKPSVDTPACPSGLETPVGRTRLAFETGSTGGVASRLGKSEPPLRSSPEPKEAHHDHPDRQPSNPPARPPAPQGSSGSPA